MGLKQLDGVGKKLGKVGAVDAETGIQIRWLILADAQVRGQSGEDWKLHFMGWRERRLTTPSSATAEAGAMAARAKAAEQPA